MNQVAHKSVLTREVIEYLNPQPGKVYLDATFGSGGHTRAILEAQPKCRVIALDWDTVAIDQFGPALVEEFGDRIEFLWGNFAHLYKLLKKERIDKVDGILADFGTSQVQINNRPGFSIYRDTPLDMRMSPSHQLVTAAEILRCASEQELCEIFWAFGEEGRAKQIVAEIAEERKKGPILTTKQLAAIVERVVPAYGRRIHPATKVFQALRIFVNKELDNISAFLATATRSINPGGRLVCISFHSLEDRLVKQWFKQQEIDGVGHVVTRKVVVAQDEEVAQNPSSRSACLRVFEIE